MELSFLGLPPGTRFADPGFLLLLPLLLALIILHFYRQRRTAATISYSAVHAARRVRPTVWARLWNLPAVLHWLAAALMIIALARPQHVRYESLEEVLEYGADIMLVMDVSGSMEALDFQPLNRLNVAKDVVSNFVKSREGDQIGLVAFAELAATFCPLTTNSYFLRGKIDELDFGLLNEGTAIGTALSTALNRLEGSKARSKVIILLTDGMNNRGEVQPLDAAAIAKNMNVKVYTVGIGTDGEVPFPNKPPYYGRRMQVGLDEELLQRIADSTGGVYRRAEDEDRLEAIYEEINELEKTEVKSKIYSYPVETEYFPPFLIVAGCLIGLELILRWTRLGVLP